MASILVTRKPPQFEAEQVPADQAELFEFAAAWNARIVPRYGNAYVEFSSADGGSPLGVEPGQWVVRAADGKVASFEVAES